MFVMNIKSKSLDQLSFNFVQNKKLNFDCLRVKYKVNCQLAA